MSQTTPCGRVFLGHALTGAWRGILNGSVFNRFTGDYD